MKSETLSASDKWRVGNGNDDLKDDIFDAEFDILANWQCLEHMMNFSSAAFFGKMAIFVSNARDQVHGLCLTLNVFRLAAQMRSRLNQSVAGAAAAVSLERFEKSIRSPEFHPAEGRERPGNLRPDYRRVWNEATVHLWVRILEKRARK